MKQKRNTSSGKADALQTYDENLGKLASSVQALEARVTLDPLPANRLPSTAYSDFEDLAFHTLRDFIETRHDSPKTSLERFQRSGISAALITASGVIKDANQIALDAYGFQIDSTLVECGIEFHSNDQFARQIAALENTEHSAGSFQLLQAFSGSNLGVVTMVMSKLGTPDESPSQFLILCSPTQDHDDAVDLLSSKFKLSRKETEIAKAFARGGSLRQIADDRKRSYATIRNQFQTVLEKTECGSQSDFLQFATGLSTLFVTSQTILNATETKLTGAFHVPRPKGRKLEVMISGDPEGTPILNLFSLFGPGVTPAIERTLKKRRLCLISPWRPGFKETSTPPKNQSLTDCLVEDITALMDSMGISNCPWLARASSSQTFYDTALRMPDRISRGVVVNGLVPRKYIAGKSVASKWTNVLMGASIVSYPVARMILGAGEQLMRRSNTASFLQKMYDHSESDKAALGDPITAASILEGVQGVVHQGLDAGVEDIVSGFAAWTSDLNSLAVPVTLYHGIDDPNVPHHSVAEFARDHSAAITLVTEQGGGQLCYSHFDRVLDLLLQHS